jgi:hypothetical protein
MAHQQTALTESGTFRYPRSRAHSRWNVTPLGSDAVRQTGEPVTTLDTPLDSTTEEAQSTERRLTQSELYPVREAFSPEHITALRLLQIAVGRSLRAIQFMATNDVMSADTEMQKLQVLLPELFCCRVLGDGFGTIVSSLMSTFEGLEGETPTVAQMQAINRVLRMLREKPFLSPDDADKQLELLEEVNLTPYPTELLDFLSSD